MPTDATARSTPRCAPCSDARPVEDAAFLASHPPFEGMPPMEVERLALSAERRVVAAGFPVLRVSGPPAEGVFVVREGKVEFRRGDEVFDVLGPGELFGFPSLLTGDHPMFDVLARTDVVLLRIPSSIAEALFESPIGIRFLAKGLRERAELVATGSEDPTGLAAAISRAQSQEEVAGLGTGLPEEIRRVRDTGLRAGALGEIIAEVVDAITARTLDLCLEELGDPGAPWAWLSFGSVARKEPGLTPDQDHTIVWDGDPDLDPIFERMATCTVAGLSAAGLPPCPSNVLATTRGWRSPVDRWITRLLTPDDSPSREAFRTTIALDLRKVAGPLDVVASTRRLREEVRGDPRLFWHVSRLAVEQRPPVGPLGGLLTQRLDAERRGIDVKSGGLLPVTDLARLLDLRGGNRAVGTRARLRGAVTSGLLEEEQSQTLEAAFETFQEVRLNHQLQLITQGQPPDSIVEPSRLEPLTRSRLRHAFRIVAHIQEGFRAELGGGRLA